MGGYSPPTVPPMWFRGSVLLFVVLLGFALLVTQTPLLVVIPVLLVVGLYLSWRFLLAIEAIADALQRMAQQREQNQ
ncbi:MAG: hypothetical protein ABEI77_03675 [Halorientalis sp.]